MNKNHFLISYFGNKRKETPQLIEVFENIYTDNPNIDTIVEPFCGTSAFSYFLSVKFPKKFKYILNDNDKNLMELYKIASDDILLNEFIDKVKLMILGLNKDTYKKYIKEQNIEGWFLSNKIYSIRAGLFPLDFNEEKELKTLEKIKESPILSFLKNENIEFKNQNGTNVYAEFKTDSNAFIFLDPPYINSCNEFYTKCQVNIYEYMFNNNINNEKAHIMLCLENTWIIKLLFDKNMKAVSYDKTYEFKRRKTSHVIITNSPLQIASP